MRIRTDPEMTPAANVTKGSLIVAKSKPNLVEIFSNQLLRVGETQYKTDECKDILIGHVITSFDKFYPQLENKNDVLRFVEINIDNKWKATKSKAEKFLKKHRV